MGADTASVVCKDREGDPDPELAKVGTSMTKRSTPFTPLAAILTAITITILLLAMHVSTAQAATRFKISTKTRVLTSSAVAYRATYAVKSTKRARVTVTIYQGSHAIRKLTTKRSALTYTATWNLRDAAGGLVPSGAYGYRVTAVAGGRTIHASGRVTLPATLAPEVARARLAPSPVKRWVGFYVSGNMSSTSGLDTLESQVATRAVVVNMFVADSETFPTTRCSTLAARGSTPMVTLELKSLSSGGLAAINNGSHDAYLRTFANAAKAYGGVVWLRPFHEMNGNWYPWGATGSNTPAQLVAAWKHVHDIFAAAGASNVKFVWCVNSESVPNTSANAIANYWPGDAYVDYTAIDAYNFGTYVSGGTWRSFGSIVNSAYTKIASLSSKPMFLAETGSVEQGGSKAAWICDEFASIKSTYTRIVGICWFNVTDGEDWCIGSSTTSLAAFKSEAASF